MKFKTFSNVYNVKEKNIKRISIYLGSMNECNLVFKADDIYSMSEYQIELYEYISDNEEVLSFKVFEDELNIIIK